MPRRHPAFRVACNRDGMVIFATAPPRKEAVLTKGLRMVEENSTYREKIDQAAWLLREFDLDAWLIFVRETAMAGDPALRLIAPFELTWESAILVGAHGERVAVVGRFDAEPVRASDLFQEVIGYDAVIGPEFRSALERIDPRRLAIN